MHYLWNVDFDMNWHQYFDQKQCSSQSQADQSQQQQQLQQQQQYQQQQQHHQQMHPSALTLPRASVGNRPPPPLPGVDKGKLALPLSPLATGVTVTNNPSSSTHGDTMTRPTKYVTRPKTPVTPHSLELTPSTSYYHSNDYPRSRFPNPTAQGRCGPDGDANKFVVKPPPTFVFPDVGPVTTWHASLPRLVRNQNDMQVSNPFSFPLLLTHYKEALNSNCVR